MKKLLLLLMIIVCAPFNVFAAKIIDKSKEGYVYMIPKKALESESISILVTLPGMYIKANQDINNWAFAANKNKLLLIALDIDYRSLISSDDIDNIHESINTIIDELESKHKFKRENTYIAGTSAGAILSLDLALNYPNSFETVGLVSGARFAKYNGANTSKVIKNAHNQKFYIVHGAKDSKIPIKEVKIVKKRLEKNSAIISYKEIPEGQHTLSSSEYADLVDWIKEN